MLSTTAPRPSRTARRALALAAAAATCVGVAALPTAARADGCSWYDCSGGGVYGGIPQYDPLSFRTSLDAAPSGLGVSFPFSSTEAATVHVDVQKSGVTVAQGQLATPTAKGTVVVGDVLTPNTAYTWTATITFQGETLTRDGAFRTLHRKVDVLFQTDTVTNDSDSASSGDFTSWVKAGSSSHTSLFGSRSISTGQTVVLADAITVVDAGTSLPIAMEMYDDDGVCFDPISCSVLGTPKATWTNGSTAWGDWATAATTLSTAKATSSAVPFSISVNAAVGFTVKGWYSVTFVA